jgi:hypothetical protein
VTGYVGIFENPSEIQVRFCFRGSDGVMGDSVRIVKPGEFLYGWAYDAIKAHGEGQMEFSLPPRFHAVGSPGDAFILPGSKS